MGAIGCFFAVVAATGLAAAGFIGVETAEFAGAFGGIEAVLIVTFDLLAALVVAGFTEV